MQLTEQQINTIKNRCYIVVENGLGMTPSEIFYTEPINNDPEDYNIVNARTGEVFAPDYSLNFSSEALDLYGEDLLTILKTI